MPSAKDITLPRLLEEVLRQRRRIDALEAALDLYFTDEQLDGQRGDVKIKFDPKGWRGDSFKGKLSSQATPDFLDAYARTLTWLSENPKPVDENLSPRDRDDAIKKRDKYAAYDKTDAKRCRSWARRKRLSGWKPPPPPPEPQGLGDLPALGSPGLGDVDLGDAGGLGGGLPADDSLALGADTIGKTLDQDLAGPWDATPATAGADDDDLDGIPE